MKTERAPGPSRGGFCQCGWETPVIPTSMTMLDQAEHRVRHLEWEHARTSQKVSPWPLVDAYRTLVAEQRQLEQRHRARIVDLEIDLESTRWDLKVAGELVEDLKADLAAAIEARDL